jgi:hypothetical protein
MEVSGVKQSWRESTFSGKIYQFPNLQTVVGQGIPEA